MCLLCGDRSLTHLGQFLPSLNCHLLCVKFASGIINKNVPPKGKSIMNATPTWDSTSADSEIVREVKRSRKLTCVYCRKKGASVGCNIKVRNIFEEIQHVWNDNLLFLAMFSYFSLKLWNCQGLSKPTWQVCNLLPTASSPPIAASYTSPSVPPLLPASHQGLGSVPTVHHRPSQKLPAGQGREGVSHMSCLPGGASLYWGNEFLWDLV